jgi:hypothetical protein
MINFTLLLFVTTNLKGPSTFVEWSMYYVGYTDTNYMNLKVQTMLRLVNPHSAGASLLQGIGYRVIRRSPRGIISVPKIIESNHQGLARVSLAYTISTKVYCI